MFLKGMDTFFSSNYLRKVFIFGGDQACEKTLKHLGVTTWPTLKHKSKTQSACLKYAAMQLNNITVGLHVGDPPRWGQTFIKARFTNQILHGM